MAGIQEYLNQIKNAIYGRDVRQAIHDGIETCYKEGKAGATDLVAREKISQVDAVLSARIDEIIAPSGEAPSAAEVTDARVGADGMIYTSLGGAVRGQVTDLKSDIDVLKEDVFGDTSFVAEAFESVTSGGGINGNSKIINVNIPVGKAFTIKVVDDNGVISGSKMSFYWWDSNNTKTSFASNKGTNTPYDFIASGNITGFSIYLPAAYTVATGSIKVEVEVQNSTNNLIEASNIESGAYENGTGIPYKMSSYSRMVKPIVCKAGTRITSVKAMNAFEYDIITGDFITSIGSWSYSYTVQNDCALKLIWNTNPSVKEQIVAGTIVAPPQDVLENTALPINSIKQLANIESRKFIQSETIRSISHRGDYLWCHGMMCGASAVIAAKRNGYRIVENDVNITSDGKMVMWHDTTLAAIGDSTHGTEDYTLAQLKAMDFGSAYGTEFAGEKILTFAEWILICKQVGVDCYIDFKITEEDFPDALAQEMVSTIKQYGMLDHVTYLNNYSKIRQYHHNARIALLTAPTADIIEAYLPYLANGEVVFNPASADLTATNSQLALDNGFGLECYYVDYGNATKAQIFAEIERVVGLGIQGISLDTFRVEDVFIEKYNLL